MKKCRYWNCGWEAEVQIFMLPFTKDSLCQSSNTFYPAVFQKRHFSFCSGILGVIVTLTFYFIIIFRSAKAEIQTCSPFTAAIVFNCMAARQNIASSHITVWQMLRCHCVMVTVTHIPKRPENLHRCPSALRKFLWKHLWKLCMHIFQDQREGSKEHAIYRVYSETILWLLSLKLRS